MQRIIILYLFLLLSFQSVSQLYAQPDLNAARVERNVVYGMFSGLALTFS